MLFKKIVLSVILLFILSFISAIPLFAQHDEGGAAQTQNVATQGSRGSDKAKFLSWSMLAAGIALGMGTFAAAIGQGIAVGKAMESLGRNPEAQSKIQPAMLIGLALIETIAIYAMVFALIVVFVSPLADKI